MVLICLQSQKANLRSSIQLSFKAAYVFGNIFVCVLADGVDITLSIWLIPSCGSVLHLKVLNLSALEKIVCNNFPHCINIILNLGGRRKCCLSFLLFAPSSLIRFN